MSVNMRTLHIQRANSCMLLCARVLRIRQHTSAYVSMRQHASAYVSIRQYARLRACARRQHASVVSQYIVDGCVYVRSNYENDSARHLHTSAYVSIRQHTSAYGCVYVRSNYENDSARHLHTSAYVSISQHTDACMCGATRENDSARHL
jgi:hypothetical protein